ncbi:hypothetical protein ACRXB1_33240, partial [Caballeronia sp. M23-90]
MIDSTTHPGLGGIALWRGSQLARSHGQTVDTGYAVLSAELPGGGWPLGTLIFLGASLMFACRLISITVFSISKRTFVILSTM